MCDCSYEIKHVRSPTPATANVNFPTQGSFSMAKLWKLLKNNYTCWRKNWIGIQDHNQKQWRNRIKAPEISFGLICNCLICYMYYNRGDHILCFYSSHYLHFLFHFLHGLKQELAADVWVFIAQLVEHCSNFAEGSGGWWLAFVECASVKCCWNISSCIKTTFWNYINFSMQWQISL